MKLFAFDDRKEDARKDVGRHHAMDLYRILGMMTEERFAESLRLGETHRGHPHVQRAGQIARDHFRGPTDLGMIRLREHALFRGSFDLTTFSEAMSRILVSGK